GLIKNPIFYADERKAVLKKISEKYDFHALLTKMLDLLVEKDRLRFFVAIYNAFMRELDLQIGRVRAHIKSSTPLANETKEKILNSLEERVGKKIVPILSVDSSLMAGVRASIGGFVFDGTLQTKLKRLKKELTN
ncbi:ATP synthase F1 subunit delta, partial [Sulfobacillus acidophilus]|nr:ATP synthase F1 subunit delta [Sulfobacillus acidophilus]